MSKTLEKYTKFEESSTDDKHEQNAEDRFAKLGCEYEVHYENNLRLKEGDIITVLCTVGQWWIGRSSNGEVGFFLGNSVEFLTIDKESSNQRNMDEHYDADYEAQDSVHLEVSIADYESKKAYIGYLLDNEQEYIKASRILANYKKKYPAEVQDFFGPVEIIPELHEDIYNALAATGGSKIKIAEVFIERKKEFGVYEVILNKTRNLNKKLKSEDENGMHNALSQTRNRLQYYYIHLEGFLSSASDSEKKKIQEAINILKNYYTSAHTYLLIKSIRFSPINLMLHRPLLLHTLVNLSGPNIENNMFRVLLFNDLIVLAEPFEDEHRYRLNIRLEILKMINTPNPLQLIFYENDGCVRQRENVYTLYFTIENVKKEWVNNILTIQKKLHDQMTRGGIKAVGYIYNHGHHLL